MVEATSALNVHPPSGTPAPSFNEREMQICTVARMSEDGKTYWVAGGGGPMYAVLLAIRLYAPSAQYITEDGVIAPEPMLPFEPVMTMVSSRAGYRALAWGTMNTAGNHAQAGFMDYGLLNTLQVDQHGNINSTAIGTYGERARRFGGPGGADSIAAQCWRTVLMTDQEKRKFVERVDFISSPGFLDGSEGARERAGLPSGTGPYRVVTPWAMYDYTPERKLRLVAISPWVTAQQVLDACEFPPAVAEEVALLEGPTEEELHILRTELDPRGQNTAERSAWVIRDGDTYTRAEG
ncbi:MAG: acyl CoA--acetate/3-ketoacid CoA transferase subunit beta [Chloroflexota bacterium]|nr:acyl CoA--acetate/3-ketoacid CoA transferase subunit beta [Chloroflexota bacterium]